ncbi:uncharacterized protein [Henckelia pumila]|uniref:uncharacterized protein n=1 Tax=Henckelia pumila TaxID=405737 RepID=UPI003C6E94A2
MNCLIWNIRGLRSSESQERLHALVKEKRIKILAILEPMIALDQRYMMRRLGFQRVLSNLSGHIWVFMSEDVKAECVFYHTQFIHLRVSAPFCRLMSFVLLSMPSVTTLDGATCGLLCCSFVLESALVDAGFEGSSFTWTNKTIWKRLDRVFVSVDWGDHFNSIRVEHLGRTVSDHCPLLGMPKLFVKLKHLKGHLKWWNQDVFGNICDKIAEAEKFVRLGETAYEADPSEHCWTLLSKCNEDLSRVTAMEADFWKQKAACNWLEDGERNTKLFHNMVKKKWVTNKIFRIWEDGTFLTSTALIQQSKAAYFQRLLTGDPSVLDIPDFSGFSPVISEAENFCISTTPSLEEDVMDAVLEFFQGSPLPQGFTATTITLVPKVEGAHAWMDFRPISLCNVTNKIISKLLYSRLKSVVGGLISHIQSGFVPGRMISDNILLAQELTHILNLPARGGNVILKLDMARAYDRVQWSFLLDVLRQFGFSEQVVRMVRACISFCKFSVNVNGTPAGFFGSTRGLR